MTHPPLGAYRLMVGTNDGDIIGVSKLINILEWYASL